MARTSRAARPSRTIPVPEKIAVRLVVNGVEAKLDVAPWTTLLDVLRDHLDLTGTKKGCDHGQCGACTVLLDGRRINSCLTLAVMKDGAEVATIEGLATAYHTLKSRAGTVRVWNVSIARGIEQMDRLRFEAIAPTFLLAVTKQDPSDD